MDVDRLRRTSAMVYYSIDGREIATTPGSILEKILIQLKEENRPYFSSMEIMDLLPDENRDRVSHALHQLVSRGALGRCKGILSVRGTERFYLYYSLDFSSREVMILEHFLRQNTPDPRIIDIYSRLKDGEILSNYEIRAEAGGAIELSLLNNYIRNNLIDTEHHRRYAGEYIDARYFWHPSTDYKKVTDYITQNLQYIHKLRKQAINKGTEFEDDLAHAFEHILGDNSLNFSIFKIKRQVRKQLSGGRLRIFDLVLYAHPVLKVNDKIIDLKYMHGSLKIVCEAKWNARIGSGYLAEYQLDVQEAYGNASIPCILAGADPGLDTVYESAWSFAKQHSGTWIISGSQLQKILQYPATSQGAEKHGGNLQEQSCSSI